MDKHEYISQGVVFAKKGNYDRARICFEQAIDLDPDFAYSWYNLANVYFHEERWGESIPLFGKAIGLDPMLQQPYLTAGLAISNLGYHVDAIWVYDLGLQTIGDDPGLWFNKGCALIELGRLVDAIAAFDHVLSLDPTDRDAAYNRGLLLTECVFQGVCQVFGIEQSEIIQKRGEIYSFNGCNFVTLAIDNPGSPIDSDPDETIYYDNEDDDECSMGDSVTDSSSPPQGE